MTDCQYSATYFGMQPGEAMEAGDGVISWKMGKHNVKSDDIEINGETYRRHYDVDGTARFYAWDVADEYWDEIENTAVEVAFALKDQVRSLELTIKDLEFQVRGLGGDYRSMGRRLDRMQRDLDKKKNKRVWA